MAKNPFSGSIDVSSLINIMQEVANGTKTVKSAEEELQAAYKKTVNEVKKLEKAQKELNDTRNVNTQLKEMKDSLIQIQEALKKVGTNSTGTTKGFKTMDDALKSINVNLDGFKEKSSNITSAGNKVTQYTNGMNQLVTVTQKGSGATATYTARIKTLNSQVQQSSKHIKNAAFATENWSYNWAKAMQSFLTYNTVTQFFNTIMNSIRDMISQVMDLDKALVELQKVTDLEGKSLEKFVNDAYEAGRTVAKTGTEMIEAATAFAKAGYKDNALELGTVAAMYTNIADEAIDAADAADMIIAQMKAFNITAQDSIHIIDAINEVSNNFAVSSADISRNLGKASAVMANAGNSMEQYIGLMTAATEVTRNASKAANGLKTLTLRLQGMNEEGEKDLDVQAQMEGLFKKLGISVYNANGELKNTYDILASLAPVYQKLSNAEKAYVTETIAGKYQAQNAAAILNNWKTAVDATATAMDSQGSAAKENEKVLNSIQGKMQQLNSAWEELSKTVFSSDLIKWFIDLGTSILNVLNGGFGKFIANIALIVTSFTLLNAGANKTIKIFKTFKKVLDDWRKSGMSLTSVLSLMINKQKLLKLQTDINTIGTKKQSITLKDAKLAMQSYGIAIDNIKSKEQAQIAVNNALKVSTLGLNVALGAASLILSAGISIWQKHKQAEEEAIKSVTENASKLDETVNNINSQIARIQELRKVLDDNTSSYEDTTSAREELIKIQQELRESYGNEADDIDLVTGSIDEQIRKLKELRKEQAQDYLEENKSGYNKAKDKVDKKHQVNNDDIMGKYNSIGQSLLHMGSIKDYSVPKEYSGMKNKETEYLYGTKMWLRKDNYDALAKELTDAANYLKENREEIAKMYKIKIEEVDKQISKIEEKAKEYSNKNKDEKDAISNYNKKLLTASGYELFQEDLIDLSKKEELTSENVQELIDKYPNLSDAMSKNNIKVKDLIKDYQDLSIAVKDDISSINDSLNVFNNNQLTRSDILKIPDNKDATEEQKNAYNDLKAVADEAGVSIETLIDWLVKIGKIAPDSSKEVSTLSDAIKTYKTNLEAINKEMDSIQNAYKTVADAQEEYNENGWISIDTLQSLLDLGWKYYDALVDENGQINLNKETYKQMTNAQLDAMEAEATDLYLKKLQAITTYDLANASSEAKGTYDQLVDSWKNSQKTISDTKKEIEALNKEIDKNGTDENKGARDQAKKEYEDTIALIKKTREATNKNYNKAMGAGSSKSSNKEKEWWEKELDSLKDQYDSSEITINEYINSLQNLLGKVGQGTEAWRKINKELQKQKLDKIKEDYNAGRISLNQYIISLQNLQKEYKQSTKEWNSLAEAIKKAKLDQLKEQQTDLKSALSAVNKVLDKQIDEYKDLKEAADDRYDDELDKLNDLQDSLNDKNDDYQRAQKAVVDFLNEQLDAINEQKDTVENYYDDVINAIEKMNQDTQESIELAEAYDALMNAMTQKTKKVYKEGLGWVWTTDAEAIKEAKKTYDDLIQSATTKEIEEQKDKTVKSLEEQIESLQDYIDSWDKVFDKFDNEKNRNLADILLGENWTEMVSNLDPQIVEDFTDAYYDLQKNLDETSKQIDELNKKKEEEDEYWDKLIKDLQDYKGEWSDIANVYEEAQNALKAKQIMGANWEKEILDRRLDVLENFKNKYNAILAEIDKVDNMSTDQASGYTALRLPGYANGGEVDYTGLAVLHGTPNKPEYVLNNSQMRNLLSNLTKPRVTSVVNNKGGAVVNNYSFGDIELPNVTNAQQFANELKSMLNITKNQ